MPPHCSPPAAARCASRRSQARRAGSSAVWGSASIALSSSMANPSRRACVTFVAEGMRVETQVGLRRPAHERRRLLGSADVAIIGAGLVGCVDRVLSRKGRRRCRGDRARQRQSRGFRCQRGQPAPPDLYPSAFPGRLDRPHPADHRADTRGAEELGHNGGASSVPTAAFGWAVASGSPKHLTR